MRRRRRVLPVGGHRFDRRRLHFAGRTYLERGIWCFGVPTRHRRGHRRLRHASLESPRRLERCCWGKVDRGRPFRKCLRVGGLTGLDGLGRQPSDVLGEQQKRLRRQIRRQIGLVGKSCVVEALRQRRSTDRGFRRAGRLGQRSPSTPAGLPPVKKLVRYVFERVTAPAADFTPLRR